MQLFLWYPLLFLLCFCLTDMPFDCYLLVYEVISSFFLLLLHLSVYRFEIVVWLVSNFPVLLPMFLLSSTLLWCPFQGKRLVFGLLWRFVCRHLSFSLSLVKTVLEILSPLHLVQVFCLRFNCQVCLLVPLLLLVCLFLPFPYLWVFLPGLLDEF